MVKSPFSCVIFLLTQPQVANQQKRSTFYIKDAVIPKGLGIFYYRKCECEKLQVEFMCEKIQDYIISRKYQVKRGGIFTERLIYLF